MQMDLGVSKDNCKCRKFAATYTKTSLQYLQHFEMGLTNICIISTDESCNNLQSLFYNYYW